MNELHLGLVRTRGTRYGQALDVWKSRIDNCSIWDEIFEAERWCDGLGGNSWENPRMMRAGGVGWLDSVLCE